MGYIDNLDREWEAAGWPKESKYESVIAAIEDGAPPGAIELSSQAWIYDCLKGHSGFSASYTAIVFFRLSKGKPLTSLTGEDDEWEKFDWDNKYLHNKRYFEVVKNIETGETFDRAAKVFVSNDGWRSNRSAPITFPYYPPTMPETVK